MNNKFSDIQSIRNDFPALSVKVHGKNLVYFDNAATTHKPRSVIEKEADFYRSYNSNIHRGVHALSQKATEEYEAVRKKIAAFLGAASEEEIVFTKSSTDSINLVAATFSQKYLKAGDEVIISGMEHHSNIVPWQFACERTGAVLRVVPLLDSGEIDMGAFKQMVTEKVKFISVVHVSNSLGTVNPVSEIIRLAKQFNIPVLIDGAQSVQHMPINVRELDCDFFVLSGHKIYGTTGTGVLYGKRKWLEALPPYQGGGDMILSVTFEKSIFNQPPLKFEAGTPNIAGIIGLGAAVDYLEQLGMRAIQEYERELSDYALTELKKIPGLKFIGEAKERISVFSFILDGVHPHDIGTILDFEGIAIRTGHHCTQPVMKRFGIPATARLSLALYNTKSEIDFFVQSMMKVKEVFQ